MDINLKTILVLILISLFLITTASALPKSYDGREFGYVSPVQDQQDLGCCFAYGTVGMLESTILRNNGALYNLSEHQAKECPFEIAVGTIPVDWAGNDRMVINLFTQRGSQNEVDSPYIPKVDYSKMYRRNQNGKNSDKRKNTVYPGNGCNYMSDPAIRVTDWNILAYQQIPSRTEIKQNVIDYGAVYATLNGNVLPGDYTGNYIITEDNYHWNGHAVIIVGWDDVDRYWIVKNSWGTKWGDNGFAYIAYDTGYIGLYSSVITGYELFDRNVRTLYHDEAGWTYEYGILNTYTHGWMMNRYPISKTDQIERIEFWTTGLTDDVDLYLYDGWDLIQDIPGNQLYKIENLQISHAGYHSIKLDVPVSSGTGEVYVLAYIKNSELAAHKYNPFAIDIRGLLCQDTYISLYHYDECACWRAPGEWSSEHDYTQIGDGTLRLRVSSIPISISRIEIESDKTTMQAGEQIQFNYMCYENAMMTSVYPPVEWKCNNQHAGTISPHGLFTAKYDGTVKIAAVCDGKISNFITITVGGIPTPEPTINPTPTLTPAPTPTSCDDHCRGTTWYYNGYSFDGSCVWNTEVNSNHCSDDPCYGVICEDHCRGTTFYHDGYCLGTGCVYFTELNSPYCYDDPCYGVICEDHYRGSTFYYDGYCLDGSCVFFTKNV